MNLNKHLPLSLVSSIALLTSLSACSGPVPTSTSPVQAMQSQAETGEAKELAPARAWVVYCENGVPFHRDDGPWAPPGENYWDVYNGGMSNTGCPGAPIPTPTPTPNVMLELGQESFYSKATKFNNSPSGMDSDIVIFVGVENEKAAWRLEVEGQGLLLEGQGPNYFAWGGKIDGYSLPEGTHTLKLTSQGQTKDATITIRSPKLAMAQLIQGGPTYLPKAAELTSRYATALSVYSTRLLPFYNRASIIWNRITATQPPYPNTWIPKSFVIRLQNGRTFWVHPNATEHMEEYVRGFVNRTGVSYASPISMVNTQTVLSSFHAAVNKATEMGVRYNQAIRVDGWELVFKAARAGEQYPVINHAKYWH